jgi:hypothetical protein
MGFDCERGFAACKVRQGMEPKRICNDWIEADKSEV